MNYFEYLPCMKHGFAVVPAYNVNALLISFLTLFMFMFTIRLVAYFRQEIYCLKL